MEDSKGISEQELSAFREDLIATHAKAYSHAMNLEPEAFRVAGASHAALVMVRSRIEELGISDFETGVNFLAVSKDPKDKKLFSFLCKARVDLFKYQAGIWPKGEDKIHAPEPE
jgi:hypothetical protein